MYKIHLSAEESEHYTNNEGDWIGIYRIGNLQQEVTESVNSKEGRLEESAELVHQQLVTAGTKLLVATR